MGEPYLLPNVKGFRKIITSPGKKGKSTGKTEGATHSGGELAYL